MNTYWSSSEYFPFGARQPDIVNEDSALAVSFSTGTSSHSGREQTHHVRPVRAF